AVSETSDPTKGWKAIKLPMEPTDPGMKLGVDRNGLYIAYNVLTGDTHTMMSVHAIPIADAIGPGGPSLKHLQTFSKLEIECFPATDPDPNKAPDAPEILLNHEFGNSFSKMFMYKITWAANKATISKMQTIPLSKTYIIPNAAGKNHAVQPAPGGKLRATRAGAPSASTSTAAACSPVTRPSAPSTRCGGSSGARSGQRTAPCFRKGLSMPPTVITWSRRLRLMPTATSGWAARGPRQRNIPPYTS